MIVLSEWIGEPPGGDAGDRRTVSLRYTRRRGRSVALWVAVNEFLEP